MDNVPQANRAMQTAALPLPTRSRHSPYWSGYLLFFGKEGLALYPEDVGIRLLIAILFLDGWVRPFVRGLFSEIEALSANWQGLAVVVVMLLIALGVTRYWIGISFPRIGLYGWQAWSSAEKWFFPQVLGVTLLIFVVMYRADLWRLTEQPAWMRNTLLIFILQMIWGFYQEYIYRGLLQTELVRRFGAMMGILVANVLFTFGPLHVYHFKDHTPGHAWIFLTIFVIGLYFGALYQRSGNLWMVGVLHGLGDFFIDGLELYK
jgi:uncharacterized protein